MKVAWQEIESELSRFNGEQYIDSETQAQQALSVLLGEKVICDAVDRYITGQAGSELVRSVLKLMQPQCGIKYCYKLITTQSDAHTRQSAAELLTVIADDSVVPWLSELIDDEDDVVAFCIVGVIEKLLSSNFVSYRDVDAFIKRAQSHKQTAVRQSASLCQGRYSTHDIVEAVAQTPSDASISALEFKVMTQDRLLSQGDKLGITYQDDTSALFIILDHSNNCFDALTCDGEPCSFRHIENNLYSFLAA